MAIVFTAAHNILVMFVHFVHFVRWHTTRGQLRHFADIFVAITGGVE
jgi:hypothetical protein